MREMKATVGNYSIKLKVRDIEQSFVVFAKLKNAGENCG